MTTTEQPIRVRRARALVVTWKDKTLEITNFLQKTSFSCNAACLDLLSGSSEWTGIDDLFSTLGQFTPQSVAEEIERLIEVGGFVVEGSDAARTDLEYADQWEWGVRWPRKIGQVVKVYSSG